MPRLKTQDTLLGTVRAARYLGIHRSTFTLWRRAGVLEPTAIAEGPGGPLYRWSTADLDAFMEKIDYEV
jgi:hypothetical protein